MLTSVSYLLEQSLSKLYGKSPFASSICIVIIAARVQQEVVLPHYDIQMNPAQESALKMCNIQLRLPIVEELKISLTNESSCPLDPSVLQNHIWTDVWRIFNWNCAQDVQVALSQILQPLVAFNFSVSIRRGSVILGGGGNEKSYDEKTLMIVTTLIALDRAFCNSAEALIAIRQQEQGRNGISIGSCRYEHIGYK